MLYSSSLDYFDRGVNMKKLIVTISTGKDELDEEVYKRLKEKVRQFLDEFFGIQIGEE